MEKIYCNIHDSYIIRSKCYLDTDPVLYRSNKSCQACDQYPEIINSKLRISPKSIPTPGKSLAIVSKPKKERIRKENLREKCAWECIRRNKEYRADFKKYGGKDTMQIKDPDEYVSVWALMIGKWGVDRELPDPNSPQPPKQFYFYEPLPIATYSSYYSGKFRTKVKLVSPGTTLIIRETNKKIKLKQWMLYDYKDKTHTVITRENYPRFFRMTVEISPTVKKSDAKKLLMKQFDETYDTLVALHEKILRKKKNRPRYNEIETYMKVYDLKENNPELSWSDIAMKMFPEKIIENIAPRRKTKKTKLPQESALEKVKYYWKYANELINKEGWRLL